MKARTYFPGRQRPRKPVRAIAIPFSGRRRKQHTFFFSQIAALLFSFLYSLAFFSIYLKDNYHFLLCKQCLKD